LQDCNFSNADCTDASFRQSNLRNVRFNNAVLVGADLRQATHYDETYLESQGMDISRSIEYFVEDLSKCRSLYKARLDDKVHELIALKHPELLLTPADLDIRLDIVT
jgi:uncharacterized protein YjbI with pentapeptide repeats